jgi:hypothetical protein
MIVGQLLFWATCDTKRERKDGRIRVNLNPPPYSGGTKNIFSFVMSKNQKSFQRKNFWNVFVHKVSFWNLNSFLNGKSFAIIISFHQLIHLWSRAYGYVFRIFHWDLSCNCCGSMAFEISCLDTQMPYIHQ